MKFQDSSSNGLKVTVGTTEKCHASTLQKQYAPLTFFKVGGITTCAPFVSCGLPRIIVY